MTEETPVLPTTNRRFNSKRTNQWLLFVGDCEELGETLVRKPLTPTWLIVSFVDALLRGYGQIAFANNPITGLLFLIGLTVADPYMSMAGLLAGSIGLLTSVAIQQPKPAIRAGATVYCSILLGLNTSSVLPALYGLDMSYRYWFYLIVGAILCVYLTSAFSSLFGSIGRHPMPCFAVPFVTMQMIVFLCVLNSPPYVPSELSTQNLSIHRIRRDISTDHNTTQMLNHTYVDGSNVQEINASTERLDFSKDAIQKLPNVPRQMEQDILGRTFEVLEESTTDSDVTFPDQNNSPLVNTYQEENETDIKPNPLSIGSISQFGSSAATTQNDLVQEDVSQNNNTHAHHIPSSPVIRDSVNINQSAPGLENVSEEENFNQAGGNENVESSPDVNVRSVDVTTEIYNESEVDEEPVETIQDPRHVDWGQVFTGILLSMTQVFGACNAPASAIMYLGLLIFSPTTGFMCLLGAVLSTLTGLLFSAPPYTDVYLGVWGFNGLLCAGAISGFCFVLTPQSAALGLVSAVFATCLQNVLNISFSSVPMPVMSVPFNISALLFLCVTTADVSSGLVRPDSLTFPERHRHDWLAKLKADKQGKEPSVPDSSCEKEEEAEQQKKLTLEEV